MDSWIIAINGARETGKMEAQIAWQALNFGNLKSMLEQRVALFLSKRENCYFFAGTRRWWH
jgi:hypothetical protein